jgi:integrase
MSPRPFLLKKRGRFWYYRLAGQSSFHSSGFTRRMEADDEARRAWDLARTAKVVRCTKTLREYSQPFFRPATCPHLRRRREEGKSNSEVHTANSRSWMDRYVLTDPLMQTLKVVVHEALYRQDIDRDPTAGVGRLHEDTRISGVFTVEELRALFPEDGLGPWRTLQEKACFLLGASTGMRRGELLALTWDQLDFEAGAVRITQAWKTTTDLGPPKSGKPRVCPLPSVAAKVLERHREDTGNIRTHPNDLVFCYDDGTRLGDTWWKKAFAGAMSRAGIPTRERHLRPHSLRHTLNTLLEARDYNPEKIRAALGWSGEAIRGHYLHLSLEHLQEQAEIVDGLFAPRSPAE